MQKTNRWRSHLEGTQLPLYSLGYFASSEWGREGNFHWFEMPSAGYRIDGRYRRGRHRHPMFVLRNNATGEHFIGQLAWSGGYSFEFDLNPEAGDGWLDRAAALTFRAAVRQTPEAWSLARQVMDALIWLEQVAPIPGFPARAAVRRGERVLKSHGEWHETPDRQWEWKGDTSSDELDGHFFAFAVYHDLVPDPAEKAKVAAAAARIADHLIEHDCLLVDLDGEHTRWGVFSPQFLNDDPNWREEQGLNSLEILSHLKVAHHLTGGPRYQEAYDKLIRDHHYAENTVDQKILPPRGEINHSDDELAFLAYYPLLRYETDPELQAIYRESLRRSWEIERPERCPLWNLIYGAVTGEPCDTEASVATLQDLSLDCCNWPMRNSHRADLEIASEGRFGEAESAQPLPAGERGMMKWNGNPYRLDSGGDGRSEDDGAFFLLPYWMGRQHGLL
jgi:hypothetical protein